jgi:hypothetical protein
LAKRGDSKASASFSEEKEAKRLLVRWAWGVRNARLTSDKNFLRRGGGQPFSKRRLLSDLRF